MPFEVSLVDVLLLLILGLLLLLFGPRRLPLLGQALGRTIRAFQRALRRGARARPDRPPAGKDTAA